ncbi:hypothetical protein HUG20_04830 [Salicibibacter cibi]|uniref:Uncharacterized protein n=1 Tax=Salicibibacter cibi TaxID=2743001 RepID=A0A7T7CEP9_9BACI|nr:hypothetical protein [Salicibibacter cibi]QQK79278.1 hypothetical protein HUG20_04830 [Salicibibacter cibi]
MKGIVEESSPLPISVSFPFNEEKIEVKKEFLRILVRLELDPARNHLLSTFFETYLQLSEYEEHTLENEVNKLDSEEEAKVMELMRLTNGVGWGKGNKMLSAQFQRKNSGRLPTRNKKKCDLSII